jgi:D-3-phosphoglycerate dehydrogenase / 2-oxoglutarate reductase
VDNIDVAAATRHGVIVVNSPEGNTIAAAEHTIAMLLALSRRIPDAMASVRAGHWEQRNRFIGVEIYNKALGVIGLGKIGREVARRARGLGMQVLGSDVFVSAEQAKQLGVELVELPELIQRSDYITVHTPLTRETRGMLGDEQFAQMKRGVRLINCARGGIIDEDALQRALDAGIVAGAALDVFSEEPPPADLALLKDERVIVTPHLGASTEEAQDRAGTDVAYSVQLALAGEFVPDAVNVQVGGAVGEEVRPWLPLVQKLGTMLYAVAGRLPSSVTVDVAGELAVEDVTVLQLAALRGLFTPVVDDQVTFVNTPSLAAERGVDVELTTAPESPTHRSVVQLRAAMPDGDSITVSGTLTGRAQVQKLVEVNGRHFDLRAEGEMVLLEYADRPGVMGRVGSLLGEAAVNIEAAQMSQTTDGADAIMLLRVDRAVDPGVLQPIGASIGARTTRLISFGD